MKKSLLVISLIFFALLSLGFAKEKQAPQAKQMNRNSILRAPTAINSTVLNKKLDPNKINKTTGGFPGGIIFTENFEPGSTWHRWVSDDLTDPRPERGPSEWLLDTWEALGDSSWRMADTTLGTHGGYNNHWYQVLDTRLILLSDTNATFSFYQRYNVEGAAGATAPYDGWDALNVRISTDSGATWQVLPFSDYDISSSWAFGHPSQGQNEGPNIPGWDGDQENWVKESISLKDYCSDSVAIMLRFAFASDMGYSTGDPGPDNSGLALFGWEIDSITVFSENTVFFFNDGENNGELTGKSNEYIPPLGGDLWHVAMFEKAIPAYLPQYQPSGTHAAVLQNSGSVFDTSATYNKYMDDVYETGPISLPDTTPIYIDADHLPYFADPDAFPNVDFWWVEARPVDSTDWEPISLSPDGGMYVYNGGLDQWIDVSFFYGYPINTSPFDLSRFAGQDVYLRWRFQSDEDEPIGMGLAFDDIVVYSPINPPAVPTGLTATPSGKDTTISLKWNFDQGITYQIWRTTPGDHYIHLIAQVKDSAYVDAAIKPFQEYDYTLKASVRFEGTSDFPRDTSGYVMVAAAEVIPATITELFYDDSQADTTVTASYRKMVLVKFTPKYYPVDLKGIKIFLVKDLGTATAAQFTVWADDGENGMPGTKLWYKNKSGLPQGFYSFIFDDSVAIDSGSFYIGYKRFGSKSKPGLAVGADTSSVIAGRTYLETDSGYVQVLDRNAIIHTFLDTTRTVPPVGIQKRNPVVADRFVLGSNYPNPFNPQTVIPFVVPAKAAGQKISLTVYNILGQKVITLFDGKAKCGLNKVTWKGLNAAGKAVGTGIYFYRLKSKNISLTSRMLFIK